MRTTTLPAGSRGPDLAVDLYGPDGPARAAVIWVHGFGSRRDGEKIRHAGAALSEAGVVLVAPDLQGHGASGGSFEDLTLERCIGDVLRVAELPEFANAPRRVLAGSSFGALVALWAAVERPGLAGGVFCIAPAFRFVERHAAAMPPETLAAWRGGALLPVKNEWLEAKLSNRILLEAPRYAVDDLARRLAVPVTIVHGRRDEQVPWRESLRFLEASGREDLDLLLLGAGDHRLTAYQERLAAELLHFVTERRFAATTGPAPPDATVV